MYKLTNKKLKKHIKTLDNMALSCDKLTWIFDPSNLNSEEKAFIKTFMLTIKQSKDFIVRTVRDIQVDKTTNKYIKEFITSYEFVDECLDDLNSIFFIIPNDSEFKKLVKKYNLPKF